MNKPFGYAATGKIGISTILVLGWGRSQRAAREAAKFYSPHDSVASIVKVDEDLYKNLQNKYWDNLQWEFSVENEYLQCDNWSWFDLK